MIVIPRDLFNFSKLLKCLGRLSLIIHDGNDGFGNFCPRGLKQEVWDEADGFDFLFIQHDDDGGISSDAIIFMLRDTVLDLRCKYNSKENYSLYLATHDGDDIVVLDKRGALTPEFINICNR